MVFYPLLIYTVVVTLARADDLGDVIFTNIIYRHGDRTPVSPYPNDPYGNLSYWPTGWGQLTQEGMESHYLVGKWLRQRYVDLLPLEYDKEDIRVRSTDVDRTLMSAYCNLAGLYEPNPSKNWSPDIHWRPIPVHTAPESEDILSGKKNCPQYDYLFNELMKTDYFAKIFRDYKALFDAMTVGSGMEIRSFKDLEDIHNTLFIEEKYKLPLPPWTKDIYPQPMKYLADLSFSVMSFTQELARLRIGPVLAEMVDHMEKKVHGKMSRKAFIYSGHDTTIANILQGLRVFDPQSPPYNSTVLIELREREKQNFVTVFYRNSSAVPPYLLTLPGCDPLCPWDKFKRIVTPVLPKDWSHECQLKLMQQVIEVTGVALIAYVCAAVSVILVAIIAIRVCTRSSEDNDAFLYTSISAEIS